MTEYSIVLLPGLDGTGELFEPLVNCLPDQINPIVFSYPRNQCKTYKELKEIVMPSLPQDQPFFMLGESFSGPLSIMIAHERPKGFMGLILCATFIKSPFMFLPSWMKVFSISPIYRLWPAFINLRTTMAGDNFREIVDLAITTIRTVSPAVIAHRVKSILSVNVENELSSCPYPALYLMAGRDSLIRRHNYKRIKAIKNDVKLAIIDTLHFVLQLEPEKSSEVLVSFMENVMDKSGEIK